jgi:hypothetical protein
LNIERQPDEILASKDDLSSDFNLNADFLKSQLHKKIKRKNQMGLIKEDTTVNNNTNNSEKLRKRKSSSQIEQVTDNNDISKLTTTDLKKKIEILRIELEKSKIEIDKIKQEKQELIDKKILEKLEEIAVRIINVVGNKSTLNKIFDEDDYYKKLIKLSNNYDTMIPHLMKLNIGQAIKNGINVSKVSRMLVKAVINFKWSHVNGVSIKIIQSDDFHAMLGFFQVFSNFKI